MVKYSLSIAFVSTTQDRRKTEVIGTLLTCLFTYDISYPRR